MHSSSQKYIQLFGIPILKTGRLTTQNPSKTRLHLYVQLQLQLRPWNTHFSDLRRSATVTLSHLPFGHNRLPQHPHRIRLSESDIYYLHFDFPARAIHKAACELSPGRAALIINQA